MFTDIGIDIGTYKTAIFSGKRIVLEEPSVVAIDSETEKPLFFGKAAYDLAGRTDNNNITIINPVVRGVVSDMELSTKMMKYFLYKVFGNRIVKPRVVVTAPGGATAVEQRSAAQIIEESGGRNVQVIETATAAAIALGLNFSMPHGSMIVDIGAGTTDIAVISMGGVSECTTIPSGSMDYDAAIIKFARHKLNMTIGPHTAEKIKMQIGSAYKRKISMEMQAGGIDLVTGKPRSFSISSDQVYEATSDISDAIVKAVGEVLEHTLPDLAADIYEEGITLLGGGSLMYGLDEHISNVIGVPVHYAEDAAHVIVRGAGIAVRNPNLLKASDYQYRTRQNLYSDETDK